MSDIAIKAEGLGKQYRIGQRAPYKTFRETLVKVATAPWRRGGNGGGNGNGKDNQFWALRDVSFEVSAGEVLGVIGRNGAGKSTLLKILSRIAEPTAGLADIYGRVGSLLEVGTGFHKELTGRENIYLNGALLGMRRAEIARKFDQIVAFSEVERFIDTPVKHYSSGMYMRLAFAVAAHLEPQILLVDEVLAVGDATFQKKCLGKMSSVATEGRTVLFVSHNMSAIQGLCPKTLWLDGGRVREMGATADVVQRYLECGASMQAAPLRERRDRGGDGSAQLCGVRVQEAGGETVVRCGSRMKLTIAYESDRPLRHPRFLVAVCDMYNTALLRFDSDAVGGLPEVLPAQGAVSCLCDPLPVTPGRCYLTVTLSRGGAVADHVEQAAYVDVEPYDVYGSGRTPTREQVLFVLPHRWMVGA